MPGLTVKVILQDIKKLETDALIVGFFEDVRPLKGRAGELDWLLCGSLSNLILKNKLRGSLGDVALLTSQSKVPAPKIFMVGLGLRAAFSLATLRSAAKSAVASAVSAGVRSAAIEYFPSSDVSHESVLSAFYEGMTEGVNGRTLDISLLAPDAASYENIYRLVSTVVEQEQN
jgi:hypothetical protein